MTVYPYHNPEPTMLYFASYSRSNGRFWLHIRSHNDTDSILCFENIHGNNLVLIDTSWMSSTSGHQLIWISLLQSVPCVRYQALGVWGELWWAHVSVPTGEAPAVWEGFTGVTVTIVGRRTEDAISSSAAPAPGLMLQVVVAPGAGARSGSYAESGRDPRRGNFRQVSQLFHAYSVRGRHDESGILQDDVG